MSAAPRITSDPMTPRVAPNQEHEESPLRSLGRLGAGSFPAKLMFLLQSVEDENLSHIVSWQPHGRAFMVHNQKEFQRQILPRWFRQTKYSSFQRQLNIYEFKRISTGPDKNGYYHLSFQRGKFDLLPRIKRVTVKGTGIRKAPHPEEEPDFYQTVTEDSSQASLSSVGVPPLTWNASRAPLNSQHLFDHASLGGHGIAPAISNLYPPLTQQLDLRSVLQRAQHMLEERQLRESLNRWTRMNPGTHPLYLPSMVHGAFRSATNHGRVAATIAHGGD